MFILFSQPRLSEVVPAAVPEPCLPALAPAQGSPAGSESCNYPCNNYAWQRALAFLGEGFPELPLTAQAPPSACSEDAPAGPARDQSAAPSPREPQQPGQQQVGTQQPVSPRKPVSTARCLAS